MRSVGRAEEADRLSDGALQLALRVSQLGLQREAVEAREGGVIPCVVSERAVLDLLEDGIGVVGDVAPEDEEGRPRVPRPEDRKEVALCVLAGPVVEGERDDVLPRAAAVERQADLGIARGREIRLGLELPLYAGGGLLPSLLGLLLRVLALGLLRLRLRVGARLAASPPRVNARLAATTTAAAAPITSTAAMRLRRRLRRLANRSRLGRRGGRSLGVDMAGPVYARSETSAEAARRVRVRCRSVPAEIDRRAMAALSSGHLATDFANGSLPALLPFLVDRFGLSYVLAAVLILASTVSSSVIQPLFGLWSDRRGAIWLLPAGVALGGVGIALAADAPAYWLVAALVVVSGIGVAAFHPEGSKFAAFVSGERRATGMALFSFGGNVGYALGPIVATPIVLAMGLRGGLVLMVPCLAVAAVLLAAVRYLGSFAPAPGSRAIGSGQDRIGALLVLLGVIALRSVAWFGLVTFVPLWEVSLGHSKAYGNHLLSLMLIAGGVGTLIGGPAADRFGRRPVMLVSAAATGPLILLFVLVGGVPGAIALVLVGVCVIGTFGVTMVMSQEYMPRRVGMASGLSIGLSIGLGGIAAVGLGAVADAVDLRSALYVMVAAPVAAFLLTLLLPPSRERRPLEPRLVTP